MNVQPHSAPTRSAPSRRLIEQARHDPQRRCAATCRTSFPAADVRRRAAPEDLSRYEARELAALAEDAWAFLRTASRARRRSASSRAPVRSAPERIKSVSIIEIVNDDMPFLLDSVLGELTEQGLDVRLVVHPIFTVERDQTGALIALPRRRDRRSARRARKLHPYPCRAHRGRGAAGARSCRRSAQVLADVRVCVQDWRPMLARVGEVIAELKTNPPPLPVDEIAEAIAVPRMAGRQQLHLPRRARIRLAPTAERDCEPLSETGLGILRAPGGARAAPRRASWSRSRRRSWSSCNEPKPLIITKANVRSRVHRRVTWTISASSASTPTARLDRRIPHRRPVHLDRLHALDPLDPLSAAQGRRPACAAPASIPDGHSGKALINVLESYPRDELFQIDEDTLYQLRAARSCSSTSARACACWRGATVSTVSSRSWSSCRATATTAACATRSATIWRASTRAASRPSIRSSPKARWCACISSSAATAARRRIPTARRSSSAVDAHRAHLDRRARRGARRWSTIRSRRSTLLARYRDAFSGRLSRGLSAAGRASPTSG